MCTNFTPTKRAQWVKETLGVDLPTGCPDESYPGIAAPVVVKSHQTDRVACGLARFGLMSMASTMFRWLCHIHCQDKSFMSNFGVPYG